MARRADPRPNVLLFFTDMQRADTIHALDNPFIRTPNLDRLVNEGTSFTSCYSPSPVCVPARCCMHYGLHPQKTGIFDNGTMMSDNGKSFPAVLGAHGYRTHAVGKCHFTPESDALRGFQSRQSQEECTSNPEKDDYVAWLRDNGHDYYEPHGARGEMYYIPQVSTLPATAHPSQWVGNESIRFIQKASEDGGPWCLFASFIHPHPPFAPPKPWHKLYRVPDMPLPFMPEDGARFHTWINRLQNRYKFRDRGFDLNLLRLIKAYYYATISFVDFQIGRMLQALDQAQALDNTLILFTSDHGEHLGDFGCFGKRSMHDASVRIPMVVRFPRLFPTGKRCPVATSLLDVFPTLLAIGGISADGMELDGQDLAGCVAKPDLGRTVYAQFSNGATAIYMAASARWKYVYSAGDDAEWLFDRHNDPAEARNLATQPSGMEPKLNLKTGLLRHLAMTGRAEAYIVEGGTPDWRRYPRADERYLKDPDAGLLYQDYPSYPTDLPGYTQTRPEPPAGGDGKPAPQP